VKSGLPSLSGNDQVKSCLKDICDCMIENQLSTGGWLDLPMNELSIIESLGRLAYGCLDLESLYSSISSNRSTDGDRPGILLRSLCAKLVKDVIVLKDLYPGMIEALSSILNNLNAKYGKDQPEKGADGDIAMDENQPDLDVWKKLVLTRFTNWQKAPMQRALKV
jgi:hypothetical protein